MADVLPPRKAVALAVIVTLAVAAGVAVAYACAGRGLALVAAVSAIAMVPMALRAAPLRDLVTSMALTAALASLGDAAAGSAAGVALVVAASALAVVPFTTRYGPVGAALPVLVLVAAADGGTGPLPIALAVVGMAAVLAAIVLVLRVPRAPAQAVPRALAATHGVALAVLAGGATWLVLAQGWNHGVWLVFGLSAALTPDASRTLTEARARIAGTIIGGVIAALVATLLPPATCLGLAAIAMVLAVAHTVAGQRRRFAAYSTALVILIAAAALPETPFSLALTRIEFITAGVAVAVIASLVVARTAQMSR